ncbi:MAG: hypothetical protein ACM3SW_02200 [Actinomycetota bacterium]
MGHWIIDGKTYNEEEYAEYKRQEKLRAQAERQAQWEELQRAQAEADRLVKELSDAYFVCEKFIREHPELCRHVTTEQERDEEIYQKLLKNLEYADAVPRCEYVLPQGTQCKCPQMRGERFCYAHNRWRRLEPQNLDLRSIEDANGIQQNLMAVMQALVDDRITEKRAAALLYGHQIAANNVRLTTFTEAVEGILVELEPQKRPVASVLLSGEKESETA